METNLQNGRHIFDESTNTLKLEYYNLVELSYAIGMVIHRLDYSFKTMRRHIESYYLYQHTTKIDDDLKDLLKFVIYHIAYYHPDVLCYKDEKLNVPIEHIARKSRSLTVNSMTPKVVYRPAKKQWVDPDPKHVPSKTKKNKFGVRLDTSTDTVQSTLSDIGITLDTISLWSGKGEWYCTRILDPMVDNGIIEKYREDGQSKFKYRLIKLDI